MLAWFVLDCLLIGIGSFLSCVCILCHLIMMAESWNHGRWCLVVNGVVRNVSGRGSVEDNVRFVLGMSLEHSCGCWSRCTYRWWYARVTVLANGIWPCISCVLVSHLIHGSRQGAKWQVVWECMSCPASQGWILWFFGSLGGYCHYLDYRNSDTFTLAVRWIELLSSKLQMNYMLTV